MRPPPHAYHAHVYFELAQVDLATAVHTRLTKLLHRRANISHLIKKPIGPHPLPMFEVDFLASDEAEVRPILEAERGGLTILIHPLTGDDLADHKNYAEWLGPALPLNYEILERIVAARKP